MKNIVLVPTTYYTAGPVLYSNKDKGAGYYKSENPLHSVGYTVTSSFSGKIEMQGTLVSDPTETDWVTIEGTAFDATSQSQSVTVNKTFKGQYVWVRAYISNFVAGSIEKISYTYN